MAEEQGLEVSIDGFNKCMDQQRERSRVSLHLQCSSHPRIVRRTCFRTQWTVLVVALFVLPCVWAAQLCETVAKQSSKQPGSKQGHKHHGSLAEH